MVPQHRPLSGIVANYPARNCTQGKANSSTSQHTHFYRTWCRTRRCVSYPSWACPGRCNWICCGSVFNLQIKECQLDWGHQTFRRCALFENSYLLNPLLAKHLLSLFLFINSYAHDLKVTRNKLFSKVPPFTWRLLDTT